MRAVFDHAHRRHTLGILRSLRSLWWQCGPSAAAMSKNSESSSRYGGQMKGNLDQCEPGFTQKMGSRQAKIRFPEPDKFCPRCREAGLWLPLSRVRGLPAHMETTFLNCKRGGLWSSTEDAGDPTKIVMSHRVINNRLRDSPSGPCWCSSLQGGPTRRFWGARAGALVPGWSHSSHREQRDCHADAL